MEEYTVPETNICITEYFNDGYERLRFDHVCGFDAGCRHPCVQGTEADLASAARSPARDVYCSLPLKTEFKGDCGLICFVSYLIRDPGLRTEIRTGAIMLEGNYTLLTMR